MKSLKPENPSKLEYFQLTREFNKKGLIYGRYRNLLWYWEQYEEIKNLGKFDADLIKGRIMPLEVKKYQTRVENQSRDLLKFDV